MKSFFLIIIISLLLFPSCAESPQIISDVCEITEQICYYANLVCENFNETDFTREQKVAAIKQLNSYNFELKNIAEQSKDKSLSKNFEYQQEVKYKLIKIRDELKKMYENQIK